MLRATLAASLMVPVGALYVVAPVVTYAVAAVVLSGLTAFVYVHATWYRGRIAMARGEFPEAIAHYQRFLVEIEGWPPWAYVLGTSLYTNHAVAGTLNNLGVCQMAKAATRGEAVATFVRAMAIDPEYALPHLNLGLIATMRVDPTAAAAHFAEATRLGYDDTAIFVAVRRINARMNTAIGAAVPEKPGSP